MYLRLFLLLIILVSCKTQYNTPQEALEATHKWLSENEQIKKYL